MTDENKQRGKWVVYVALALGILGLIWVMYVNKLLLEAFEGPVNIGGRPDLTGNTGRLGIGYGFTAPATIATIVGSIMAYRAKRKKVRFALPALLLCVLALLASLTPFWVLL